MTTVNMTTQIHGPLFDGRTARAVHAAVDRAIEDVATEGVNVLRAEGSFFRKSGYWDSRVATERRGPDAVIEDDAVYNDWLAGESERNNTSRFKGYAHWRKATQRLQDDVPRIVHQSLRRAL